MTPDAPAKRRGPKRALSKGMLIDATLQMLDEHSLDEFSMPKLARRIGAGVMTLYTYYPGRDALLDDVAEEVFRRWQPPEPTERWQDYVLEWQVRLLNQFLRYPIGLKVIAWDDHMAPSWWKIWSPILRIMDEQGLKDARLAAAAVWFSHAAIGLIHARVNGVRDDVPFTAMDENDIPPAERHLLRALRNHAQAQHDAAIDYGFVRIVDGLEALIAAAAPIDRTTPDTSQPWEGRP